MTRFVFACLLLCGCRLEKDKAAVPAATTWVLDDTSRTAAGARRFSLTRDGAFTVEPGRTTIRPRIVLTCTVGSPVVVTLVLPRNFLPPAVGDSDSVLVRWRTNEASPLHTQRWVLGGSAGDSLAAVRSPAGVAPEIRTARALTLAFVHAPRAEELSFELTGLNNYLQQAAAMCTLDPSTLLP